MKWWRGSVGRVGVSKTREDGRIIERCRPGSGSGKLSDFFLFLRLGFRKGRQTFLRLSEGIISLEGSSRSLVGLNQRGCHDWSSVVAGTCLGYVF